MDKLTVKYEIHRVNPFVPLPMKGKPPTFALISASMYRNMLKYFKNKKCKPLSENGGYVKAKIMNGDTILWEGLSTCSMSDKFDAEIGMRLALTRAINIANSHSKMTYAWIQSCLVDLLPE